MGHSFCQGPVDLKVFVCHWWKELYVAQQGEWIWAKVHNSLIHIVALAVHNPDNTEKAEGTTMVLGYFSFYTVKWRIVCCL